MNLLMTRRKNCSVYGRRWLKICLAAKERKERIEEGCSIEKCFATNARMSTNALRRMVLHLIISQAQ